MKVLTLLVFRRKILLSAYVFSMEANVAVVVDELWLILANPPVVFLMYFFTFCHFIITKCQFFHSFSSLGC